MDASVTSIPYREFLFGVSLGVNADILMAALYGQTNLNNSQLD